MRPEERDKAYLWDMLDAALAVDTFIRGKTFHDYLTKSCMSLSGALPRTGFRN